MQNSEVSEVSEAGVRRAVVRPDVSSAVGTGETLHTAVTVVAGAERAAAADRPVVFAGFPGGGYSRHYYDLAIEGYSGYSQAAFHAAAGDIFLCCDPVAIGDSDVPTQGMDYDAVGRANAATVRAVVAQLAEGGVVDGLGPVEPAAVIAMGQSFGGFCLTMGQAVDPYFDAVAFLGWSGLVTLPPFDAEKDLSELLSGEATVSTIPCARGSTTTANRRSWSASTWRAPAPWARPSRGERPPCRVGRR